MTRKNQRLEKTNIKDTRLVLELIAYLAKHGDKKLYKSQLNAMLYFTQDLHIELFSEPLLSSGFEEVLNRNYLEDLDIILDVLIQAQFIKFEKNDFGVYVTPLVRIDNKHYDSKYLKVLKSVLKAFNRKNERSKSGFYFIKDYISKKDEVIKCDHSINKLVY